MKATETTILKFIGGEDKVFIIPLFREIMHGLLSNVKNSSKIF